MGPYMSKNESLWKKEFLWLAATELFIMSTLSKNERFRKESVDLVFKLTLLCKDYVFHATAN